MRLSEIAWVSIDSWGLREGNDTIKTGCFEKYIFRPSFRKKERITATCTIFIEVNSRCACQYFRGQCDSCENYNHINYINVISY